MDLERNLGPFFICCLSFPTIFPTSIGKILVSIQVVMTQRYAHLRDETLKRASDLIVDLIPMKKKASPTEEPKKEKAKGRKKKKAPPEKPK
jgi:hypothetical protein